MVKITFPDGSVREYEQGVTGLQIAESISPALARNVVSCGVNGETVELNRPPLTPQDTTLRARAGEMLSAICKPVTPCSYSRTDPAGNVIFTRTT